MNKYKKWLSATTVGIALLLTGCAGGSGGSMDKNLVFSLGDYELTESEFYEIIKNENYNGQFTFAEIFLQEHIIQTMLKHEYGDNIPKGFVETQMAELVESFGGKEKFEELLEVDNLTEEFYRGNIELQRLVLEAYKDAFPMEEGQLELLYDDMVPNEQYVSHILFTDEEKAKEVLAEIKDGGDFEELMVEHSTDEVSLQNGGEMLFERGVFVSEFEEAALKLSEVGDVSDVVETEYGYHIIKLIKAGEKGTFEEEKDALEMKYYNELMYLEEDSYGEIITNLLDKYESDIVIHDEAFKGLLQRIKDAQEEEKQKRLEQEKIAEEQGDMPVGDDMITEEQVFEITEDGKVIFEDGEVLEEGEIFQDGEVIGVEEVITETEEE